MKPQEIKDLRAKLKLSQRGLAEKIGCTLGSVEHYEQGYRKPSAIFEEQLQKLAKKAARVDKKEAPGVD
jgi:DNA-binding transcriptional regulator YiaG